MNKTIKEYSWVGYLVAVALIIIGLFLPWPGKPWSQPVEDLRYEMEVLSYNLTGMNRDLNQTIDSFNDAAAVLHDDVNIRLQSIETKLNNGYKTWEYTQLGIVQLREEINGIGVTNLQNILAELRAIENEIALMKIDFNAMNTSLTDIDARLKKLEK